MRAFGHVLAIFVCLASTRVSAATLQVGPGKTYAKPCLAIAAATAGDVLEIDAAGDYDGDVCRWETDRLTIRGVNGRAKIDAAGANSGGKAIWVVAGDDTVIENVELSGCTVPDRNGAGIRQEGRNLTVRGCYFHHNENGILTNADSGSHILIERSEFAFNGAGDGQSHNLYIGHVAELTLRHCYSHHARSGHLVKSRAAVNRILYNRLSGEADGTASYELDLPNGGTSYVIGNLIHQGQATQNGNVMTFQVEGPHLENPGTDLYVVNNTFVNDRTPGGTFVMVGSSVTTPAIIRNNLFVGAGTITSQANAVLDSNLAGADPLFVDRATYDCALRPGSPAIDQGVEPGVAADGTSLAPEFQYVHPSGAEARTVHGAAIDQGAFEYADPSEITDAGTAGDDAGTDGGIVQSDADVEGEPLGADAGGCGCTSAGSANATAVVAFFALVVILRRRARRGETR